MKDMNKLPRKAVIVFLALLAFTLVVYGYTVWERTTEVEISEPFHVEDNLPSKLTLYPGDTRGPYFVKVTNNHKEITYTATLNYTVTASQGVSYVINPPSGESKDVKPGSNVIFYITITIPRDSASGQLTIDWRIERS